MNVSLISILCLALVAQCSQAQFWGSSSGLCRGRYEQYRECASTCPDTCDDIRWPNQMKMCTMVCRTGCDCIRPFVRLNSYPMSPCVHPRQCYFA